MRRFVRSDAHQGPQAAHLPRLPRAGEPGGFGVAVARGLERAVVALVLGELFKKLNELRSAVLANQGSPTTATGVELDRKSVV